jgi:hypothetical protein
MNSPKTHGLFVEISRAVLIIALALLTVVVSPRALARDQVPFKSTLETVFDSSIVGPIASVHVTGGGRTTHMGFVAIETNDEVVNLGTGVGVATFRFVAANGDTVDIFFDEMFTAAPGGFTFEGTWKVIAGTGRFAGASGTGVTWGSATFTGETTGIGFFEMEGTITSPGSLK